MEKGKSSEIYNVGSDVSTQLRTVFKRMLDTRGPSIAKSVKNHRNLWFLCSVLLFVNLYSFSTLTMKPAFWYDEAINVELAHNFADFGKLDIVVAPNTFSGAGATVGSTGYPVTVPLAGFFKLFGFGLEQARVYMLLWMSAFLLFFFFIAKKLWGSFVTYWGTLLIASFAPFYGNGRSVMGEIPGFLFFLCSFYFFEKKKWLQSGILLGLAVVSKPSVFVFLIPAYVLAVLCSDYAWKEKFIRLFKIGVSSVAALIPWFVIYAEEIARGGLAENILNHFKNPYAEAGVSALANINNNLPTLFTSTTLLYIWIMLAVVIAAIFLDKAIFQTHKNLFILASVYFPLALFQYLKSFGYLRYLIAFEFIVFILFLISLPILLLAFSNRHPRLFIWAHTAKAIVAALVIMQTAHLFLFSDLYLSEKTQKTLAYLSSMYSEKVVGVMNVPQVGSMISADKKYQYLSTYGLWQFGVNPLLLPSEKLPDALVIDSLNDSFSALEKETLQTHYDTDMLFLNGFIVHKKK